MSSRASSATRTQALVTALQWGLVQALVLDTLGGLFRNYYRATTESFFAPGWVSSIEIAVPLGLLIGGIGGYRWITTGRGTTSVSAHRNRVVFVGTLVTGWALAFVPTMAFQVVLGDRLWTVPYFVLPTLPVVGVLVGAYLLAYRVDAAWYRRRRSRLLGTAQGAVVGVLLGFVGTGLYGAYLALTRTSYSYNGGRLVLAACCLGAITGYLGAGTDRAGDRAAEFLVLLIPTLLALSLVTVLTVFALGRLGLSAGVATSTYLLVLLPVVLGLVVVSYLTYWARTEVFRRFVARRGAVPVNDE